MLKNKHRQSNIGMALAESMIAIMILQVAVLSMIYTVNAGHAHIQAGGQTVDASRLGEELIEEILTRVYTDPEGGLVLGPDAGEVARNSFDDIDDYQGYTEAAGAILLLDGSAHDATVQSYSRSVTVSAVTITLTDIGGVTVDGKTIVVTVTDAEGRQYQITRFVRES